MDEYDRMMEHIMENTLETMRKMLPGIAMM